MLILILMVLSFVLFLISGATFLREPPATASWPWRYAFVALGLACWVLAEILKNGPLLTR
jgi:hypothetical protein